MQPLRGEDHAAGVGQPVDDILADERRVERAIPDMDRDRFKVRPDGRETLPDVRVAQGRPVFEMHRQAGPTVSGDGLERTTFFRRQA